jgi:triphosphatase
VVALASEPDPVAPYTFARPSKKEPVEGCAQKALQKRRKTVAKCGRSLRSLDPDERHKMRRSLKKLQYTVELFAPIYAKKDVKGFVRQLKALQDSFGYVNDVRTAEQLHVICAKEGDGPDVIEAGG